MNYKKFIEEHTTELDYTRRGGNLKVNASSLFPYIENATVGAYQNYLGGDMLGAVIGVAMFTPNELKRKDKKVFKELLEACKKYFHEVTNEVATDYDEWSTSSYEQNQNRPKSAY